MKPLKSDEIENLLKCGKILKAALFVVSNNVKPGISTNQLNKIAEQEIRKHGARPSFLNYDSENGNPFPSSLCVSVNSKIVHGIPSDDEIVQDGDVVGLDLGCEYNKMFTDSAVSVIAGNAKNKSDENLIKITKKALYAGIANAKVTKTTGDIGFAIESVVNKAGYKVIKTLVGHGIGRSPHEDPQIPNFGKLNSGSKLVANTAIAIEPMVVIGENDTKISDDGWTVETLDGGNSSHFEHTVLITDTEPNIIT